MKRILVAYSTNAGSTAEVAEAVRKNLEGPQVEVQILPIEQVRDLDGYAGVVLGGPMIVGWHRRAARFFRARRRELARVPVALFFTALRVTRDARGGIRASRSCWTPACWPSRPARAGCPSRRGKPPWPPTFTRCARPSPWRGR